MEKCIGQTVNILSQIERLPANRKHTAGISWLGNADTLADLNLFLSSNNGSKKLFISKKCKDLLPATSLKALIVQEMDSLNYLVLADMNNNVISALKVYDV